MSRWRAGSLVAVHVLMIAHVLHWFWAGRTLSPVEPSETMYALNQGFLNAGAIFFALAILSTLVVGRFVCGWGCHVVAYQDLCAWALKKVGIRPKPFRSRLLVFAPLALAIYMFVWPTAFRWWSGIPAPGLKNHLVTSEFWATFPGPVIAVLTLVVCGFGIVYFLGSKGFCTYACPYGGFFGLAEPLAPGRILVTDACNHCGHCTSACTSNVRVHEEVATFGMVVDPGCMKCMDCVSVCPNDALYFGFSRPAVAAKASSPRRARDIAGEARPQRTSPKRERVIPGTIEHHGGRGETPLSDPGLAEASFLSRTPPRRARSYDFSLGDELAACVIGVGALLSLRGLYGQVPLLFAMGLSAMTAFGAMKLRHLLSRGNVRWQNLSLKRGGAWTRAGVGFATGTVLWIAFTVHSGFIQYWSARGLRLVSSLPLTDDLWAPGFHWWATASAEARATADRASAALGRVDKWGLLPTPSVLPDLARLYLAKGDVTSAERTVRRFVAASPKEPAGYRGLASVLRKANRIDEAIEQYRAALAVNPAFDEARDDLCAVLAASGRYDEAIRAYEAGIAEGRNGGRYAVALGEFQLRRGDAARAREALRRALGDPDIEASGDATLQTRLAIALLGAGDAEAGIARLRAVLARDAGSPDAHYNLGYALLVQGRITEALPFLRRAVSLKADVALWHYNLAVATFMSGDPVSALPSVREAIRLAPDDAQAHGFLAVVLEALGDPAGAAEARSRAERLRPSG